MTRQRILLIDDDPSSRSLLTSFLRRDFVIFVAGDGCEGFNKAIEQPPDLVVMELQLQGWNGLRTLKMFRDHPIVCRLPIVVISSDASRETVTAAVAAGADDYVLKLGLNREAFVHRIQKLLSRAATQEQRAPQIESASTTPSPHLNASHDRAALQAILDDWD